MSGMPWVKVFPEMLEDPKIGRLPDAIKWRFISLLLVAGECDAEGYLVNGESPLTTADLAWRLRTDEAALAAELSQLQAIGVIVQEDAIWFIPKFAARQGRPQSEKRELWRNRKQRQGDGGITRDSRENHAGFTPPEQNRDRTETETEGEGETDKETEGAGESPAAVAVLSAFGLGDPLLSKAAAKVSAQEARAWVMYASLQDSLKNPAAFVGKRIMDGKHPPADFLTLAAVSKEDWTWLETYSGLAGKSYLVNCPETPETLPPEAIELFKTYYAQTA